MSPSARLRHTIAPHLLDQHEFAAAEIPRKTPGKTALSLNLRAHSVDVMMPGDLRGPVNNQRRRAIIFRSDGVVCSDGPLLRSECRRCYQPVRSSGTDRPLAKRSSHYPA